MVSVLTMDQGGLLQQQLPIHNEYSLSSEHDFNDQYSGHAHHVSYGSASSVDHLRRDGGLPQQVAASFFTATNHNQGPRFVPERGVASDGSSYQGTNNFTDSGSGSISTSPSSAASSLQAYTNYPATIAQTYASVQQPQAFVPSPYADQRVPSLFGGSFTSMLPPPSRPSISTTIHAGDRDEYATNGSPYLARGQLSPHSQSGFGTYPDTPRNALAGTVTSLSPGLAYPTHMTSAGGYGSSQSESTNFPWPNLEVLLDMTCEGQSVTPEIHAKVEKGFFPSTTDQKWTCYRRNYFSVACNFELHPSVTTNGRLFLKRNDGQEQIQAMGMRLSAAVDGSGGKSIELIQHTPKRDNGPKSKIDVTKVSPTPSSGRGEHTLSPHGVYQVPISTFHATGAAVGPLLPLQNSSENGASSSVHTPQLSSQYGYSGSSVSHHPIPGQNNMHSFERVQFKQATANNGKRRASQQYFHLIVELFADVRKANSDTPTWVKVAQRVSEKIVVRGRSPSHYQTEGPHGQNGRGGSASGGSGYSTASGASYGSMNTGGFRSSVAGSYGGGSSGAAGYRANHYGVNQASDGDGSGSSPGSVDEGAVDTEHPMDSIMSDTERAGVQDYEGYQYYPSTIYEGTSQHTLPPFAKVESMARYSSDPRYHAVKAEYTDGLPTPQYQVGGCGRFQGVESSRGYYPDFPTNYS